MKCKGLGYHLRKYVCTQLSVYALSFPYDDHKELLLWYKQSHKINAKLTLQPTPNMLAICMLSQVTSLDTDREREGERGRERHTQEVEQE